MDVVALLLEDGVRVHLAQRVRDLHPAHTGYITRIWNRILLFCRVGSGPGESVSSDPIRIKCYGFGSSISIKCVAIKMYPDLQGLSRSDPYSASIYNFSLDYLFELFDIRNFNFCSFNPIFKKKKCDCWFYVSFRSDPDPDSAGYQLQHQKKIIASCSILSLL